MRSFRAGDTHTIALAGDFELATIDVVDRELEHVGETDSRLIVLDLRELAFIDSSGLRVIVMAHRRESGRLRIVKGPERLQRVFEMCDMVTLLPFVDEPPDGEVDRSAGAAPPIELAEAGDTENASTGTLQPAA